MHEELEVTTIRGETAPARVSRFGGFPDEGICGFRDEWQPGVLHAVSFHDSKPHHHEEMEEIFLVLEGSGRIVLGDTEVPVGRWDSVRVPVGVSHMGMPDPGGDLVVAVFFVKDPPVGDPEREAKV
jgi:mannose-6-phosphate isomerase-like protein (cupin superfamily)